MKKQIAILGSTGSIGKQTLEVIAEHPDFFEVYAITAHRSADLLIQQARQFRPEVVVIADESLYKKVSDALSDLPIKVWAGADALCQVVEAEPIHIVVTAMVGFAGLRPTVSAIKAHKTIALANKETLVVAGGLIEQLVADNHVSILPVDSEHSAIFQCLQGEIHNPIDKLIITASGGPFRTFSYEQMRDVTAAQALKHPNWDMGAKITIDSASMMNKGFEVIEAKWLFGVKASQIQVLVHPQSIVHSAVQFDDGAVKAQLGVPDMRLPIQYAFSYPKRLTLSGERLDLFKTRSLEFFEPDLKKFRCLALAFEAIEKGGNMPCIVNAANEVVNLAFRQGRISFPDIARLIRRAMDEAQFVTTPTLETYLQSDADVRHLVESYIQQ